MVRSTFSNINRVTLYRVLSVNPDEAECLEYVKVGTITPLFAKKLFNFMATDPHTKLFD